MNANDIHLQKLNAMVTQLVEQLKLTQSTKPNFDIEDVFKSVNQILKITQADKTTLRDFQKTIKALTNSHQFENLSKSLYTLDKTFKDPDIKQLKNMNITANKIFSELSVLEDTLKNINIPKNEKANLTLLSKSIAEGHRLYSVQGFGKNADQFYKNATIQQLLLLQKVEKNLKDGVPLKGLTGKGILKTMGKVGASGPITSIADVLLKSAGMGELPGQITEMLASAFSKKPGESSKEDQANAARVAGLQGAKDAAKGSIIFNKDKMANIETALNETRSYKETLTNDLASALARTLKTDDKGVDARFAKDEAPYEVDMKKLTDAIREGSLSKDEIESLIKTKYIVQTESGEANTTISDALISKVETLDDYKKAIDGYKQTKIDTAKELQTAYESFAELANTMKTIMTREIVAEFKELDKAANELYGKKESKEKEGFLYTSKNVKLQSIRDGYNIAGDEQMGISKYVPSNIENDYNKLGELTGKTGSAPISTLLEDFETQQILQQNNLMTGFENVAKVIETKTETVKDLLEKYEKTEKTKTGAAAFAQVRERTSIGDIPESLRKQAVEESAQKAVAEAKRESEYTGAGIDIDKVGENANRIYTEMMENLLTSFKDQDTMANQKQVDSLKKILEGGTVNVRVSNLNDILSGSPGSNVSSPMSAPKSAFGE